MKLRAARLHSCAHRAFLLRVHQLDYPRRRLAIGIAALAGFVDAVGYLSAGGYFTSFMSGNTTRLGVDFASDTVRAAIPIGLIAGFVTGVVLGALVAEIGEQWRKTRVLALATGLLVAAALFEPIWHPAFLGAAVLAMGALNNVFRRNGEVAVGVTYMTGALVRFGQGLSALISGRAVEGRLSAGGLWLGLATGATMGATAFSAIQRETPWIAAIAAAVLLFAAWRVEQNSDQTSS